MRLDGADLLSALVQIARVVPFTLGLAIAIMVAGIVVGALLDAFRRVPGGVPRVLVAVFVSYMRGVPVIVNLFIASVLVPMLVGAVFGREASLSVPPVAIAIVCLGLYEGAVQAENLRGILRSVDRGQLDAARAVGMTMGQGLRHVVIPQLMVVAVPVLINSTVKTIKTTSLLFAVSVVEIMSTAQIVGAIQGRYLEAYLAAALVYWAICGVLTVLADRLERRFTESRGSLAR